MGKHKAEKNTLWIRPVPGALMINLFLLIMMLKLLGDRPIDHFREYHIYRQELEQKAEVYGKNRFSLNFHTSGGADSFELHVDSKDYAGTFGVRLLNASGDELKSWQTDKMRILDAKQGRNRWIYYVIDPGLLTEGNEYCIEVYSPGSDRESSVFISGFSTYRKVGNYFAVIALVLLFASANIWWFNLDKPVEKWAFPILLATGLIMFFIMSPSSQTDENLHYYSTLKVSSLLMGRENLNEAEGRYFAELKQHYNSNESFMKLMQNILTAEPEDQEDIFICRNTYSFVQPAAYLAPAIGMTTGRLLGWNYYLTYSAARLFNLLSYVFMVWLAIRMVPYNKELILMVGMMPMAMHQAASLSYDVCVNGLSLIFFAYVLKLVSEKRSFTWRNAMVCAGILGTLGPVKVVYSALFLLLFIIPSEQFKGLKDRLLKFIPVIVFAVGILWLTRLPDIAGRVDGSAFGEANPYYDINFIFHQPFAYIKLFAESIRMYGGHYVFQAVGYSFAGQNVFIPEIYVKAYLAMLVLNQLFQEKKTLPGIRQRAVLLITSAIISVGILTIMMLAFTQDGRKFIEGVQGRYFIPVLAPVLYSLAVGGIPLKINRKYLTGMAWFTYMGVIMEVMSCISF